MFLYSNIITITSDFVNNDIRRLMIICLTFLYFLKTPIKTNFQE